MGFSVIKRPNWRDLGPLFHDNQALSDAFQNLASLVAQRLTQAQVQLMLNGLPEGVSYEELTQYVTNQLSTAITDMQGDLGAKSDSSACVATKNELQSQIDVLSGGLSSQLASQGSLQTDVSNHVLDYSNPHHVTASQVGLGNVANIVPDQFPVSTATQAALDSKADLIGGVVPLSELPALLGLGVSDTTAFRGDYGNVAYSHVSNTNNPHGVTKAQVGLGAVDNTSDALKPISNAVASALSSKLDVSAANAALANKADLVNGLVPASQLPSFVDDVLEFASLGVFPATGETGKIYVATGTNITYRWSGSGYVEISASLALGETDSTAYRGDRGAQAYAHVSLTNNPHGTTKAQVGLANVDNTSDVNKPVSTATQNAIDAHANRVDNPHGVTKAQVGLSNVDNTSDANKPVSTAVTSALNAKADLVIGKVPLSQLPTILVLGTTSTSAFQGDFGSVAYAHVSRTDNPHATTKAQVGLGNVDNTSDASKPLSAAQQSALDGKSNTGHTHAYSTLTSLYVTANLGSQTISSTSTAGITLLNLVQITAAIGLSADKATTQTALNNIVSRINTIETYLRGGT